MHNRQFCFRFPLSLNLLTIHANHCKRNRGPLIIVHRAAVSQGQGIVLS